MDEDEKSVTDPEEWVEVKGIRRYKATIPAENVPGDNFSKKITNVNGAISKVKDFMGSKVMYLYNKAHICVVFGKKESGLSM